MKNLIVIILLMICLSSQAHAEPRNYNAAEGNVSSVLIFEQSDFARVYGIFTKGVARISYDDQTKVLDNLKMAFLINGFRSSSRALDARLFGADAARAEDGKEVAFVQSEPVRLEGKVNIKGDLVINGLRHPVVFQGELNKYGRINQSTDVGEDGPLTLGLSMHTSFKRSDFGLSMNNDAGPFQDDVLIMFDIVATQ